MEQKISELYFFLLYLIGWERRCAPNCLKYILKIMLKFFLLNSKLIDKGDELMGLMSEYIGKKISIPEIEAELMRLIGAYNKERNTYLFVYAAAIGKQIPAIALEQTDYYIIHDMLSSVSHSKLLDFYLETPGGSGETVEDIVRFLRKKFEKVSFVVSGEAKSAGTILVLSGSEILMTESGSLGPIDAQIKIGRSIVSAYDYMEWVENKRKEAEEKGNLNPFDAVMIAQITPGEIGGVDNSLKYAQDLVEEWLPKFKFKDWTFTETRKIPVTDKMKKNRAMEISNELINHTKWRSHGRSIKIEDLKEIGLKVINIDENKKLADITYRIQTLCRLLFEGSTIYKIFATQENKIFKQAVPTGTPIQNLVNPRIDVVEIKQNCPKCGKKHNLYAKFSKNKKIDEDFKSKGFTEFPQSKKLTCDCGFEIDLSGILNQIEIGAKSKVVL